MNPVTRLLRRLHRKLTIYRHPISILMGRRQVGVDDLRVAVSPVLVERGRDDSVLIIAFTGGIFTLSLPVYEFFDTTKMLGYSRILLRDQYRQHYHRGIDDQRADFPSLVAYLKEEIARLSPEKVMCIGTSAGGYAAIRAGHELRANYVHAFGPQTGAPSLNDSAPHRRSRRRLWQSNGGKRSPAPTMDLAEVLRDWNQKTTYYIHYARSFELDRIRAAHLFRSPGVVSLGYPGDRHQIAIFLAKKGFLGEALAIRNQDRVGEIAKARFGEDLELHGSQPDTPPNN